MKKYLSLCLLTLSLSSLAADYDKIVSRLKELDGLPHTTLFSLGKNDQGMDILGIVIGDASRATQKYVVVGTHHGNEKASALVPLLFAEETLKTLKNDEAYFIIPVLNISGYNRSRREETGPNNKNHDPNRDYEDACTVKEDFKLKSTKLLADLMEREDIVTAVTIHGYIGTFTFPWGTNAKDYETLDHAFLEDWAKKSVSVNKYQTGTHGGAIYPAAGAFEDWAYYKHGVWSYLLEIKSPYSDLKKDALALVEFFKHSPTERSRHLGQKVNCVERLLANREISRP
jgi:carboxypeptidase T